MPTMCLADLIRAYHGNLTRNELKIARARLRRAGVTRLHKTVKGPYKVPYAADAVIDTRADIGTVVAEVAAHARRIA